jgi:hypothetical protein
MSNLNSILSGSLIFRDNGTELSRIVPSPSAVNVTGSLRVSGSAILLNGSDLAYRITVLEAGQGADQVNFGELFLYTASTNEWTSSAKVSLTNLNNTSASLLEFTASQRIINSDLQFTSSQNTFTASNHEIRLVDLENSGLVSGSQQIFELGFLSSSIQGIVSSSRQISNLGFITASRWIEILEIPDGIISSSQQLNDLQDPSLISTGSITASVEINGNVFEIVSASNQLFAVTPDGTISGSVFNVDNQIILSGQDILTTIVNRGLFAVTGSFGSTNKDIHITGSLLLNFDGATNFFSIDVNGQEKLKVNEEGVLKLGGYASPPTSVQGAIYYGDDDAFYLGFNT